MASIVFSVKASPAGILPVIAVDRDSGKPLCRQIYEGYRDAIVERRLRPGQRIPPSRSLAAELRISRIPVLTAFEQLVAEGYFESRVGSGTFVASSVPDELSSPKPSNGSGRQSVRSGPRLIGHSASALRELKPWFKGIGAFSVGQPPVDQFPVRLWSRLVARRSRRLDARLLNYAPVLGYAPLREAVAEYLRTARGVRCEAAQVMIVNGAQHALELSARVLLDADNAVWMEDPGCYGLQNVLRLSGVRIVPVPVDGQGLVVSEGVARCPRARAVYVTPSHQFPVGVTMSASRRLQLLDWAQGTGAWIVEDDYDSEYRYGSLPITSLQGLDRNSRVIYVGTFSKIMFPALRIGYVVIPTDLIGAFMAVRRATDKYTASFPQAVLADFIEEGHFARHTRRMRMVCGERRTALVEAIRSELGPAVQLLGDPAGMYLTVALSGQVSDREIAVQAAREGLWTAPLSDRYLAKPERQGLILGYGGTRPDEIERAVRRLKDLLVPRSETVRKAPITPIGRRSSLAESTTRRTGRESRRTRFGLPTARSR